MTWWGAKWQLAMAGGRDGARWAVLYNLLGYLARVYMDAMKRFGIYLMCSRPRVGAIYTGMSGNIPERAAMHAGLKQGGSKWAQKYKARHLVYYEIFDDYMLAREREEKIKKWDRAVKVQMIESFNPSWTDLRTDLEWKLAQ